jgi:uncharacterized protein YabE (DUF348 family)
VHRRVETQTSPLREVAPPPVERTDDPKLPKGETVVDDDGEPARTTSVRRLVYAPNGKLLSDSTWYSSYRAEPKLVRVGTKAKPKPEKPGATTTTQTTTQTTTTTETVPEPPH